MRLPSLNWGSVLQMIQGSSVASELNQDRLRKYRRWMDAYKGYKAPQLSSASLTASEQAVASSKLRFNFNKPIIELGAAFLAGGALKWKIDPQAEGDEASKAAQKIQDAAFKIWDRSGSDTTAIEAARICCIYGDIAGMATQDAQGRPRIEFVNPDRCTPQFQGSDAQKLVLLQISWEEEVAGKRVTVMETISPEGREVMRDGEKDAEQSIPGNGFIPAAWIRNHSLMGESFGISDLDGGVVELSEAYAWLMEKRERIIEYHADPHLAFKGARSGDLDMSTPSVLYIPTDGDAFYLARDGDAPDIEAQRESVRNDLSEVSMVPAVAFGRQDSGLSAISGVALRILYGPLVTKTNAKRASWGPALEYLMWLCLRAEGHEVPLESVNVRWPDPVPVNEAEQIAGEKDAVDSGIRSVRTAARHLGSEDPDAEYERIRFEHRAENLKLFMDAGLSLEAAAEQAGYTPDEIPALMAGDAVDNIVQ